MKLRQRTLNCITSLTLSMLMLVVAPLSIIAATPSLKGAKLLPATNMVVSPVAGGVNVPITGTTDKGGKFTGNFQIQQFSVVNNQIVAVGTLTGTISNAVGNVIGTVLKTINLIVTFKKSTCEILELELGPLDLDLLGLQVHLNKVVLDITADPSGGLLGSLLCAIANLLNNGGLLTDIVSLLNQVLALL
jgi:hypothetical protein